MKPHYPPPPVFHVVGPAVCHACGYDLRATIDARCPECGTPDAVSMTIGRRRLERRQRERSRARWAVIGCACALLTVAVLFEIRYTYRTDEITKFLSMHHAGDDRTFALWMGVYVAAASFVAAVGSLAYYFAALLPAALRKAK